MTNRAFPVYRQLDQMDCGPTCLRMIAKHYGKYFSLQTLRESSYITRDGVTLKGISEAATKIGFRTLGAKLTFEQLDEKSSLPCILHWKQNHFVVLPPQNYDRNKKNDKILIADPAHGLVKVSKETFLKLWITTEDNFGIALFLEPTPFFYDNEEEKKESKGFSFLFRYLKPYKKYIAQLFLGMLVGSLLSLIAPFLTQSLVDYGINQQNPGFIYLILMGQLALFFGNTAIEVIRGWLLLHMNTRINISIISDFLIKLMKLPIRFFDTKMLGDVTQRISDHNRIEQFLTGTSLNTLFSLVNLVVFSIVLGIYSLPILFVFITGSALSIGWILFFLGKRRELNYARFQQMSDNQNNLFEIITGMQDIKMNDSETTHRWNWEKIQAKLFHISIKSLSLDQYQNIGSTFFTQLKNILATFLAAQEVLKGNISLGMMLSVSYIIGQMNSPIEQLLKFFQSAQDAKISLERLSEIHLRDDEESGYELTPDEELDMMCADVGSDGAFAQEYQADNTSENGLTLEDVSFQYAGPGSPMVLSDINLTIPFGKVTAIVGASGSGKTTLMKLLLKFYEPIKGKVNLGHLPINNISAKWWRKHCGVVMSDGYIFSGTIAQNISVQVTTDPQRLMFAMKMANIDAFVNKLPLGVSTKIGNTGNGISSGQRQRILIARAIYKQPKFIFLDEATSTLDANNEKVIIENLQQFFQGRTVVVIAHRLSTVKHADQIVVMENGRIVEEGNHKSLTALKGKYYELVKNQLELGN
ncbi:ATP-binding cassette subfamily B protein [Chitinophaga niastensis]|uniref:ATP-binding cassette subfamily B protein n=1 Tax=Chitinophaga niastensis TaxID=536980 RepID=A0A2P8HVP4_CHINA|nr:peptidase domain-containing ABC transporter [Chitinophaga niastensis]PSL50299.1 ATP-binding cassette subfamily B protein [Chitinophaga niastensis]